jgi:hypothetical protein
LCCVGWCCVGLGGVVLEWGGIELRGTN